MNALSTAAGYQAYLARMPERLVLEGYRGWTWAISSRSPEPWQSVCGLYAAQVGEGASRVLEALDVFASTLGRCADCPLRMLRRGCGKICREEAIVLALVSAIQHADEPTVDYCLHSICKPAGVAKVALAAGLYGILLRGAGFSLEPVPVSVIAGIEEHSCRLQAAERARATLH